VRTLQIVEEARTVILAGGTLQPISELRDRLFPQLPHEKVSSFSNIARSLFYLHRDCLVFYFVFQRIDLCNSLLRTCHVIMIYSIVHVRVVQVHLFSCGHIVPPESILPIAIARGPGGLTFDFTYQSRSSPTMVKFTSSA